MTYDDVEEEYFRNGSRFIKRKKKDFDWLGKATAHLFKLLKQTRRMKTLTFKTF